MLVDFLIKKTIAVVSRHLQNFFIDIREESPPHHSEEETWALAVCAMIPLGKRNEICCLLFQILKSGHNHVDGLV